MGETVTVSWVYLFGSVEKLVKFGLIPLLGGMKPDCISLHYLKRGMSGVR